MKNKEELLKRRKEIIKKLNGREVAIDDPCVLELESIEKELAKLTPGWKQKFCPRCGEEIGFPALSRTDNKTEICKKCGSEESMNEFYKGQSLG